jgi:integrase
MVSSKGAGSLLFSVAADDWLKAHSAYIRPSTRYNYSRYLIPLNKFFGALVVKQIHIGHVRAYQTERRQKVCARRVNQELKCCFIPVLKESNRWKEIGDLYHPLPVVETRTRQNLSEEQERRLLACALDAAHPRRLLAGHCMIVMCNTGMGFGELRHLRRKDVIFDVAKPFVTTNPAGVKNDFRVRSIPLNWLALRSLRWIVHRWENLGGNGLEQYILPHYGSHAKDHPSNSHNLKTAPDFFRPMEGIERAARAILDEAGLGEFVAYDMRSTFITKLLSDPTVSDQMIKEIVGHAPKSREVDRYSWQRLEKKAVAVDKLALEREPQLKLIAFPGGKK